MHVRPGVECATETCVAVDGIEVAGSGVVTIGVRLVGESRLRWVAAGDVDLEPGDQVLVDDQPATVVVAPNQLHGSITSGAVALVPIAKADASIHFRAEPELAQLDRILASFPHPGSTWSDDNCSGMVEAINVKNGTFEVRSALTGESVTIQHLPGREQTGHGNLPRGPHSEDN